MTDLVWQNDVEKLGNLKPYSANPRTMTVEEYAELKKSLDEFGLVEVPAVDTDNTIIAGHQRIAIMLKDFGPDREICIRKPNRKLTEKEFKSYLLKSNKVHGNWNFDILANEFEIAELQEIGFVDADFGIIEKEEVKEEKPKKQDHFTCPKCGHCFSE
jgi:hypothetical protein